MFFDFSLLDYLFIHLNNSFLFFYEQEKGTTRSVPHSCGVIKGKNRISNKWIVKLFLSDIDFYRSQQRWKSWGCFFCMSYKCVCVFFCTVGCTGLVSVWKMCVRPRVQDESSTTVIVFQEGTDSKVPLRKPTKRLSWRFWVWYCTEEMESETDVIKQNIQKSILTLSELGDVCILLTLTNMTNRGESRASDWFVCSGLP